MEISGTSQKIGIAAIIFIISTANLNTYIPFWSQFSQCMVQTMVQGGIILGAITIDSLKRDKKER